MLNKNSYYKSQLKRILIGGFVLRFLFLFLVVVVFKDSVSPYVMSDDIMYEDVAKRFLQSANSIFDFQAASILGVDGYLEVFWPYVMCFSAKLFHTELAGRILNCIMSTYCIYLVYNLTELISKKSETAISAAKLFAFLPYPLIICCFPLKDIFLTTVVLILFTIFVKFQNDIKIPISQMLTTSVLLVAVSFTRGAVVEFICLAGSVFIVDSLVRKKKFFYAIILVVIGLIGLYYMWDSIMNAFGAKIDVYNSDKYISTGFMRYLQINKLTDIWRLPATYFFAMIQPISLSIFSPDWSNWGYFLRMLNITIYPIAFGNLIYAFTNKYNKLFWYISFVMYACVFSLSLGIFRHYLFLFPCLTINYACNQSMKKPYTKKIVTVGSVTTLLLVIILSIK